MGHRNESLFRVRLLVAGRPTNRRSISGRTKRLGAEDLGPEVVGAEYLGAEDLGAEVVGAEDLGAEVVGVEDLGAEVVGAAPFGVMFS